MIEEILYHYLQDNLTVPVMTEMPEVPSEDYPVWPDQFVTIEKVGGGKINQIESASFAVQSHASTLFKAASLDSQVRVAMEKMSTLPQIGSAKLSSNYNHTDPTTKRYRYQSVFDIYFNLG